MATATFRGRRGIECLSAVAARVAGWRLVLDKPPLVTVGHSFANIVPDAASVVWGVLYEIAVADLDHIELTEGVLIDNYRRIEIDVIPRGDGEQPLRAFTLSSDKHDPTLRPSTRYMNLLISGAEEHGLPAEYVAWLRAIPALAESAEAAAWQPVFDEALRRN
jgi:hypothetical protein